MNLHDVNNKVKSKPDCRRIGRGPGSGWGTTAGRGMNGAQCRSGWKAKAHFEGGQMSIARRIPKRGFNNKIFGKVWSFVNLRDLNAFEDGDTVTPEECLKRGLIPNMRSGLKVLGQGTLERKLTVRVHRASKSAQAAIEAKGGTVELIPAQGDLAKKQWKSKRHQGKSSLRKKAAIKRAGN
jgi:large subunit ribosomal protein L15